jgi:hypothetical protein
VQLTAGGTTLPPEENTLDLVVAQRNASTLHLRPAATTRGASRDFSVPDSTDQNVPLLREIGAQTYEQLFPERLRAYVRGPLEEARSLRLVWDQDHGDRGLAILPWESLYASPMGPFLGLTRRCSLVRYFPGAIIPRLPLRPPLRMLVVMCSPAGAPRLDLGREKAMLEETVGADPRFDLDFLMEDQANLVELSARVAAFQPHVLHCVAHGVHADDDRVGALLLCEPDGKPRKVTSAQLATSLGGAAIRLAVLNSCDTGRSSRGDVVSGIAAALVSVGVPAVIATTRKVSDDPAIIFARAFYRAFLGGYMLEAALVEARAALHANDWDWAAYALFAGTLELDAIKVGPAPPFRGASIGSGNSPR